MDGKDGSDGCAAANAAKASVVVLSPLSRSLQSATEKKPASHPNTLHLGGHNLTFEPPMSIVTAPTTRTNSGSSFCFWETKQGFGETVR